MSQVRQASLQWISLAIQKHHPKAKPEVARMTAEDFLYVAEENGITVEQVREWIHENAPITENSLAEFGRWAYARQKRSEDAEQGA